VDPCLIDATVVAGTSLEGLVGTPRPSISEPWLECTYRSAGAGPLDVSTLSAAQLASSIEGLTAPAIVEQVPEEVRFGTWQAVSQGPFTLVLQTAPGLDGPGIDALLVLARADPAAQDLLRVRQDSTGTLMQPEDCEPVMTPLVEGFVAAVAPTRPAETDAALDRLVATCEAVTGG
jgi:hypothetical protein